jgi:LysM repeat protein
MADPVKQPAIDNFESNAVRLRSSSGDKPRDIGSRRDRPAKGSKPRSKSGSGGSGSSRDRGTATKSGPDRTRTTFTRAPGRPRDVKPAGGAKVLAPIALILCALACFVVLTSTSDDKATPAATVTKKSTTTTSTANGGSATVTTRSTYKVKAGDSFAAIAEKLNLDANTLAELNPDIDPRALQPGQKLKLK